MSTIRTLLCFTSIWFLAAAGAAAQPQSRSGLEGRVLDPSGASVQNATIEAVETTSGRTTVVSSREDGSFTMALAPGRYRTRVASAGFSDHAQDVEVGASVLLRHDVQLQIAGFSEQTVVVTATRSEKPLKDVPATLNVVSQDEIVSKGMRYIGDELQSVPGVFVQKNDEGAWTGMSIRGVPSQHHNDTFLALLDGVPFVTGNDEVELELIPADIVERVEVVKGPMSALYGRGSIAGAVNFISRPVPLHRVALANLGVGSYGYARPSASVSWPVAAGKSHFFVSGYGETKDGWRDETGRKAGNLFVKNQTFIDDKTDLTLSGNLHGFKQHVSSHVPLRSDGSRIPVAGGVRANYNIQDSYYDKRIWMASGVLRRTGNRWNLRAVAHARDANNAANLGFNEGADEEAGTISWNGFNGKGTQRVVFVEPQVTFTAPALRVVAGSSYERVSGISQEFWTGQYGFSLTDFNFYFYSQRRSYQTGAFLNRDEWITDPLLDAKYSANIAAAYAQAEVDLGSRTTVAVGLRADRFARDVDYRPLVTAEGPQPGSSVSDADGHLSPKVSATVKVSPSVSAYGAFGEGFSPAFGPVWAFGGRNVSLKPEVARSVEGGIKGDLAGGRLSVGVAVFRLNRRDLLQLLSDGPGTRTVNAGSQRSQGVEFDSRMLLRRGGRGTTAYARYAWTDSLWTNNRFVLEFTGEEVDLTGKRPMGIPSHQLSVGLTQHLSGAVSTTAWFDLAGRYFIDGVNAVTAPSVGQLNASVSVRALRQLDIQVTGTNLTNAAYYYYLGTSRAPLEAYPAQPFQVLATVRWRLGR